MAEETMTSGETQVLETIDREKAKEYLKKNLPNNRSISKANVEVLKRILLNDLWVIDGNSIGFDKEGFLINGQHRLQAVVSTGVPIKTFVTRGLSRDARGAVDTGLNRSARAILKIYGFADSDVTASGVRTLVQYMSGMGFVHTGRKGKVPHLLLERAYEKHKDEITDSRGVAMKAKITKIVKPSVAFFVHFVTKHLDRARADEFFDRVLTFSDVENPSTASNAPEVLKTKLIKAKMKSGGTLRQDVETGLVVSAWNAFYAGKNITKLNAYDGNGPDKRFMNFDPKPAMSGW